MVIQGQLRLGVDDGNNMYIDRDAWERSIIALSPDLAISRLQGVLEAEPRTTVTLTEAATHLRVSPRTIRQAIRHGHLTCTKTGIGPKAAYRIPLAVLNAWSDGRKKDAADVMRVLMTTKTKLKSQ